jgi:DNA-binding ferritin-like protein
MSKSKEQVIQELIVELTELQEKCKKLYKVFDVQNDKYTIDISDEQGELLKQQYYAMSLYCDILRRRLANLGYAESAYAVRNKV